MNKVVHETEVSGDFPATRWSLVLAVQQGDGARARRAQEKLEYFKLVLAGGGG